MMADGLSLACCLAVILLLVLTHAPLAWAQTAPEPVAWFKLDSSEAAGVDASGQGHHARVTRLRIVRERLPGCALLDGTGGLEVPSSHLLHAGEGFALECWVRFDSVTENMNLISKAGEYLLRVDPAPEGCNISFFVEVNGSLEPRVRGPVPVPGRWYHLVATWNGDRATLWVNGRSFVVRRRGNAIPTDEPVLIGQPSRFGPVGLKGALDEVRLYNRPLSDREVLAAEYGFDTPTPGPVREDARFDFTGSTHGWEARGCDLQAQSGGLRVTVRDPEALLTRQGLAVTTRGKPFVSLRMSVSQGHEGRLLWFTTGGARSIAFPLRADGQMHTYVLRPGSYPEWSGTLTALALAPIEDPCDPGAGPAAQLPSWSQSAAVEPATAVIEFLRVSSQPEGPPELEVLSFCPDQAVNRVGRACRVVATVRNIGGSGAGPTATLTASDQVHVARPVQSIANLESGERAQLDWEVTAAAVGESRLQLELVGPNTAVTRAETTVSFTPPVHVPKADYVPEPQVADTGRYLVGAHYCPLWKEGSRSGGWTEIVPFPERKPALGWYDEGDPEVTDWELKWALEHGISFFVYCWYRTNQGHGVDMFLEHAIHEGLFHSRYGSQFKFAIMWENQLRGQAGVASEDDFLNTLLPFWIETYFKHPSYLKIDNKPLLFIYRPEYLVEDLGGVDQVRQALDKAREACIRAGFSGLTILGEYRGTHPDPLRLMAREGLDYSFAYCWPVGGRPTPEQALAAQESYWQEWHRLGILPGLLTVSMGWDSTPWGGSSSVWRLSPNDFRVLCQRARNFMETLPPDNLASRMVLLDNWNEFGEGHYIAPHRQYGFGYLDAVRSVFATGPQEHTDLIPEDVGLGPYDSRFRKVLAVQERCATKVTGPGELDSHLMGWWSFDEPEDDPVAMDWSGNGLGALVENAARVTGQRGKALQCAGGSAVVPRAGERFGLDEITVECWIRTDTPDQEDRWFVNNVYGDGTSGFRLGLSQGRLCWAIPRTAWSHHLRADAPLPLGRWVHVAGTCDGQTIRLYMDGRECATMPRVGPVFPNTHHLCLGNYDRGHRAHFIGLLDEVRLYSRALSPAEIAQHAVP